MISVAVEGVPETIAAVRGIRADLRKEANSEIRAAAKKVAGELVVALRVAASSSGVPVAARVASSAKVKSDRFPTVVIGGTKRVGRRGAPAGALVWGAEHGGRNFAAAPSSGYWIAPTVEKFAHGPAIPEFTRAIEEIVRRHRLED